MSVGESQVGDWHAAAFETGKQLLVALWSEGDSARPARCHPGRQAWLSVNVVGRKTDDRRLSACRPISGPPGTAKELLKSLKVTK